MPLRQFGGNLIKEGAGSSSSRRKKQDKNRHRIPEELGEGLSTYLNRVRPQSGPLTFIDIGLRRSRSSPYEIDRRDRMADHIAADGGALAVCDPF
jgi:hypothetical protein